MLFLVGWMGQIILLQIKFDDQDSGPTCDKGFFSFGGSQIHVQQQALSTVCYGLEPSYNPRCGQGCYNTAISRPAKAPKEKFGREAFTSPDPVTATEDMHHVP